MGRRKDIMCVYILKTYVCVVERHEQVTGSVHNPSSDVRFNHVSMTALHTCICILCLHMGVGTCVLCTHKRERAMV